MGYASAKRRLKGTNAQITLNFNPKTLGIIREILKILKIRDSKHNCKRLKPQTHPLQQQ
jgi:hypothetical protein